MKTLIIFLAFILMTAFGCSAQDNSKQQLVIDDSLEVHDFESCVAAGYPVARSYPPQCATSNSQVFFQEVKELPTIPAKPGSDSCNDQCGDGSCQEIVCQAVGCPCAESADSCPGDCNH